jgi:hypothetical protein
MDRPVFFRKLIVVLAILLVGLMACGMIGVILGSYGVDIHFRW